ncbi:hypothetical protein [Georgenia sp. SUBG003]|uniref:hypothetical protein n=1 Tax=Georgenia sp. SUBG003 TaxID=1497974 RepID=UPI000A7DEE27
MVAPGDGGALVNQLILTADSPLGDVVYGIDNSFAARAIDAGGARAVQPRGTARLRRAVRRGRLRLPRPRSTWGTSA